MNGNGDGGNNNYADLSGILLDVVGIIINLENLRLNEEQTNGIMQELSENQDKMLERLIELCKIIVAQNENLEKQNLEILSQNKRLEKLLQKLAK